MTYVTWSLTLHLARKDTLNKTHNYVKRIHENLQTY